MSNCACMHAFALLLFVCQCALIWVVLTPSACPLVTHQPRASISDTHTWGMGARGGQIVRGGQARVCVCVCIVVLVRE